MNMTLGGRPRDGPGHRSFNMSLREDIYQMLEKVPTQHRSDFIEQKIAPILEQMDPGPACGFLREIDETAKKYLLKAQSEGDYAKAMAIDAMMHDLDDYRALCRDPRADRKNCENIGGTWKGNACIAEDNSPDLIRSKYGSMYNFFPLP
jgi:hypothetical protein